MAQTIKVRVPVTPNKKNKKTPGQLQEEIERLKLEIEKQKEMAYCYLCDEHKPKSHFYKCTDMNCKSGVSRICKKCAYNIACPPDEDGNYTDPTKATVMTALEYLDKPFIGKIWDSAYYEYNSPAGQASKTNIWVVYIRNVSMPNYVNMRWKDGDIFKTNVNLRRLDNDLPSDIEAQIYEREKTIEEEIQEKFIVNRKDVIKQVGYDPFANYQNESDKPFLYSSLNNFIDEETKHDGMKMKAVIQIVKTYNQIEKINDAIDSYVNDPGNFVTNIIAVDKLTATVDKLIRSSAMLAKDNGISVNFNNNKSKGANTLSGKIKKLNEIGFRDAKINTFDIETCEGMRQVAELSEEARHKQIRYNSLRIA